MLATSIVLVIVIVLGGKGGDSAKRAVQQRYVGSPAKRLKFDERCRRPSAFWDGDDGCFVFRLVSTARSDPVLRSFYG